MQHITTLATSGSEDGRIILAHVQGSAGSISDGGALVYLIETPDLRIFFQDTSGCWTGVLGEIDADVALLAASGRGNVNGEPIQGSMADFIALEAELLGARQVILGHHDNWMLPITRTSFDLAPVRQELARRAARRTCSYFARLTIPPDAKQARKAKKGRKSRPPDSPRARTEIRCRREYRCVPLGEGLGED